MKVNLIIKGISPLQMNAYTVGSISDKITLNPEQKEAFYLNRWRKGLYIDDEGYLVIPSTLLQSAMFEGGKKVKKGIGTLSRLVYPGIAILDFESRILVDGKPIKEADVEANEWLRTCKAKTSGMSGSSYDLTRACIPAGWEAKFTMDITSDRFTQGDLQEVIKAAGMYAGLMDQRPSAPKKPGPFGRFELTEFNIV